MNNSGEASLPWFEDKITKTIPRNKSKKSQPLVLKYDIFLTCAEVIEDDYWKKIFIDAAHNKLPKNLIIRDGYLSLRNNKNGTGVNINQSTSELINNVINFMKKHCNMQSGKDIDRKKKIKDEVMSMLKPFSELTWKELNTRSRQIMITEYCKRVTEELNQNEHYLAKLNRLICYGLLSKKLTPANIDYSEGQINNIQNIDYDNLTITTKIKSTKKIKNNTEGEHLEIYKHPETYRVNLLKYWLDLFKPGRSANSNMEIDETTQTVEADSYCTSTTAVF